MSYIKVAVDSGDSKASAAFKPFHNFLVNNFRLMPSDAEKIFLEIDYVQIFIIVGGKVNVVESSIVGEIRKMRGGNAYSMEIYVSNQDWQSKQYEEFREDIITLLKSGFSNMGAYLKTLEKLKNSDLFNRETSMVLDGLSSLYPANFKAKLTLIEDVVNKSYDYWNSKD